MPSKAPVIGVFGGSFNPPHLGHLLAAVFAMKQYQLDQVWFVPAYEHAFGKKLIEFHHRASMCEKLIKDIGTRFKVCDVERKIKNPGKALYTLEALAKKYPKKSFRWIIGSDLLSEVKTWHKVELIKKNFGFLVVPRGRGSKKTFFIPDISSTGVRRKLKSERHSDVVTPEVLSYIRKNGLYNT